MQTGRGPGEEAALLLSGFPSLLGNHLHPGKHSFVRSGIQGGMTEVSPPGLGEPDQDRVLTPERPMTETAFVFGSISFSLKKHASLTLWLRGMKEAGPRVGILRLRRIESCPTGLLAAR